LVTFVHCKCKTEGISWCVLHVRPLKCPKHVFKHKSCNSYHLLDWDIDGSVWFIGKSLSFIQDLLIVIKQSLKFWLTLHFELAIVHAHVGIVPPCKWCTCSIDKNSSALQAYFVSTYTTGPFLFHSCVARRALTWTSGPLLFLPLSVLATRDASPGGMKGKQKRKPNVQVRRASKQNSQRKVESFWCPFGWVGYILLCHQFYWIQQSSSLTWEVTEEGGTDLMFLLLFNLFCT